MKHCHGRKKQGKVLQFGSHFSLLVVETFAEKELLETPEVFEAPFSEEEHTTRLVLQQGEKNPRNYFLLLKEEKF